MPNPKTGQNASGGSPRPTGSSSTGAASSWGARIVNLFRPNFGKDGPVKGGSRTMRLIMGTLIFVLVGQLLITGLAILDSSAKLGLQQPVFQGVGWLTWFFLIYFLMIVGLWFLLNYLGFFPRPEPISSRNSTGRTSSGSSSGDKKGTVQIPGIGGPRARLRRAEVTPPTTNGRKGAADTSKAAKPSAKATEAPSASGDYDKAYERVKAAQRQKRRRELR
jgi:hypothetical protein